MQNLPGWMCLSISWRHCSKMGRGQTMSVAPHSPVTSAFVLILWHGPHTNGPVAPISHQQSEISLSFPIFDAPTIREVLKKGNLSVIRKTGSPFWLQFSDACAVYKPRSAMEQQAVEVAALGGLTLRSAFWEPHAFPMNPGQAGIALHPQTSEVLVLFRCAAEALHAVHCRPAGAFQSLSYTPPNENSCATSSGKTRQATF